MLIDEVEALWAEIDTRDNWAPLMQKIVDIGEMRAAYAPPALEQAAGDT
jgi:hypothetical protein